MPQLHDLVDNLKAGKVFMPDFKRSIKQAIPDFSVWLRSASRDAVCFDGGHAEALPSLKIIPALFRLPYPVVWFECQYQGGIFGCLLTEGDGEVTAAVINKSHGVAWYVAAVGHVFVEGGEVRVCQNMVVDHIGAHPYEDRECGSLEYLSTALSTTVGRFLMAVNCTNVARVEHPAPKSINARRTEKGKQPIYSYWTLHLTGKSSNDSADQGGTHASPRIHLRRGHVREYAPGKFTWVEACVVGDKDRGMVAKDYRVTP